MIHLIPISITFLTVLTNQFYHIIKVDSILMRFLHRMGNSFSTSQNSVMIQQVIVCNVCYIADLGIDLDPLIIDDDYSERTPEMTSSSFLVSLYTVYGLLFHMGYILKSKHRNIADWSSLKRCFLVEKYLVII